MYGLEHAANATRWKGPPGALGGWRDGSGLCFLLEGPRDRSAGTAASAISSAGSPMLGSRKGKSQTHFVNDRMKVK